MTSKARLFLREALVILATLLMSVQALAQSGKLTVEGTVLDDMGEPMIGAGVMLKNTVIGTITDIDGRYSITVDAIGGGGVLIFSSLGFDDVARVNQSGRGSGCWLRHPETCVRSWFNRNR